MTKSERRIRESFLALLDEQGFYSIRVSMILERADVSRATFYSIYEDKYQLLQTLEDELLAGLEAIMVRIRTGGRNGASLRRTNESSFSGIFQLCEGTPKAVAFVYDR